MERHLILGTAGHIDHGKTALVKALTGIDCDTHKEEKRRGITINLGFAHLDISGIGHVGIIDVPGHRDFIHTMIGGACGIDMALLVIAANEGVMPQTREHLEIMELLGISTGIVALNKADLVSNASLCSTREEVCGLLQGSFLEDCPVIPVSAVAGSGIHELKEAIAQCAQNAPQRPDEGVFRLFIDRIFSVSGFGTVVTGSVLSGSAEQEGSVFLLPGSKELRIRRIERYGKPVPRVVAGDRASLNLVGLNKDEFGRGMLLSDIPLAESTRLDARLTLFKNSRPLELWSSTLFLLSTFEAQARVHLIDCDTLQPGGSAVVQILLPQPCATMHGDRFIIRDTSGDRTLGGGEILDPRPLNHRRRPPSLVAQLRRMERGKLPELVAIEIGKHTTPLSSRSLAHHLNASAQEVHEILVRGLPDIRILSDDDSVFAISEAALTSLTRKVMARIVQYHRSHEFDEGGLGLDQLVGMVGLTTEDEHQTALRLVMNHLVTKGMIKHIGSTWASIDHRVNRQSRSKDVVIVEEMLKGSGLHAPVMQEFAHEAAKKGISSSRLQQVLHFLAKEGTVIAAEGTYLSTSTVGSARKALLEYLTSHPEGATVAQFRDLIGGNRKICLLLLGIFDGEGTTHREGDVRKITEKGRAFLDRDSPL